MTAGRRAPREPLALHVRILIGLVSGLVIGIALNERQRGPWEESRRPMVENVLRNRVGVRLRPERVISWDHAKLPRGSYPID